MENKKITLKNRFLSALKKIKRTVKAVFIDITTIPYLFKANSRCKIKRRKIKVAFMCQYIPAWNKFDPLYREMLISDKFEPYLVCIPDCINKNEIVGYSGVNETYKYFNESGYINVINAYEGEKWVDLEGKAFDYIFYTRPYNHMMPLQYKSSVVKKYTRIGSLNYGMEIMKEVFNHTLNTNFYKDVYIYYAETNIAMKVYKQKFPITTFLRLRKVEFHGYPVFEQIIKDKEKKSPSWEYSKNEYRVMWTPRWTTARHLGGSNFFMYYKSLINYAKKNGDIDFLLRPHPLTFSNFIKTGEMTEEEVNDYLGQVETIPNMSMDKEKEYNATIWGSDVLIADISAFMPEYYVTGKPIIFCASNMFLELTEDMEMLLKGCYISYNEEDTYKYLEMLKLGEDPLKSVRQGMINQVFGDALNNSSKKIIESVYNLSV